MTPRLLKKLKEIVNRNFLQNKELEWAHVYHDSIRGKDWLERLPLNVGRWAGSYAFFYILNRILAEHRPNSILEMGLGESSKFVSKFLEHTLHDSKHVVIEQSTEWRDAFQDRFQLSDRSEVTICELTQKEVKGHSSNCYAGIEAFADRKFDLYLIDGPFGSPRYSRYDMVRLAESFQSGDEFIMVVDDYQRPGEFESAQDLLAILEQKQIKTHQGVYEGKATVFVIATEKYKHATTF